MDQTSEETIFGIKNQGKTGYINSAAQALYRVPDFVDLLLGIETSSLCDYGYNSLIEL